MPGRGGSGRAVLRVWGTVFLPAVFGVKLVRRPAALGELPPKKSYSNRLWKNQLPLGTGVGVPEVTSRAAADGVPGGGPWPLPKTGCFQPRTLTATAEPASGSGGRCTTSEGLAVHVRLRNRSCPPGDHATVSSVVIAIGRRSRGCSRGRGQRVRVAVWGLPVDVDQAHLPPPRRTAAQGHGSAGVAARRRGPVCSGPQNVLVRGSPDVADRREAEKGLKHLSQGRRGLARERSFRFGKDTAAVTSS